LWQLSFARLLSTLRLPAFWAGVVLLIGGSVGSLVLGQRSLQEDRERHDVASQQRLLLQLQPQAGPSGRAVDPRLRVLRPPSALASWASGFERSLGSGWDFGPASEETLPPYPGSTLPGDVDLDVELIIRLFGGILAVFLGVWVVQSERASGWLAVEAATQTPAVLLRIARFFGILMAVATGVVIWAAGVHLASAYLSLETSLPADAWPDVGIGVAMFLSLMAAIGALVAARIDSSSGAQATALGIWAVWSFIVPQVVMATGPVVDTPVQFESSQRDLARELYAEIEYAAARHVVGAVGFAATTLDLDEKADPAFESIEADWLLQLSSARAQLESRRQKYDQLRGQESSRWRLAAAFSPAFNLHTLIAESLGIGPGATRDWMTAVGSHRQQLEAALFDDRPIVPLRLPLATGLEAWSYPRHLPLTIAALPQFVDPVAPEPSGLPRALAVIHLLLVGFLAAVVPARS
jgi:hypothetical protein